MMITKYDHIYGKNRYMMALNWFRQILNLFLYLRTYYNPQIQIPFFEFTRELQIPLAFRSMNVSTQENS
jgi:hypothetical protein